MSWNDFEPGPQDIYRSNMSWKSMSWWLYLDDMSWWHTEVICPDKHRICLGGYMSWRTVLTNSYMSWPSWVYVLGCICLGGMSWPQKLYVLNVISCTYVLSIFVYVLGTNRLYMSWVYVLTTSTICPEPICPGYMSWALLLYVLGTKCLYMSWWYVLTTKTICPERIYLVHMSWDVLVYVLGSKCPYMSWGYVLTTMTICPECIYPGYMSWALWVYVLGSKWPYMSWEYVLNSMSWKYTSWKYVLGTCLDQQQVNVYSLFYCLW